MNAGFLSAVLFLAGGVVMAAVPVDQEFLKKLATPINGIYFSQVEHYTPEKIETEFRAIVNDPGLASKTALMANLLFLVRKKEVKALRPDVERVVETLPLEPIALVSAMKTLYAIGDDRDRALVDQRFARRLFSDLKAADGPPSPFLAAAERVGGAMTLQVLRSAIPDAQAKQRQAEQTTPGNHLKIGQLDKVRAAVENQATTLERKMKILAMPAKEREAAWLRLYLGRAGHLGFWAYQELRRNASPQTADGIRYFLHQELNSVLPPAGLSEQDRNKRLEDLYLRGLLLLKGIGAALTPEEQKLLDEHQEQADVHIPDWEDTLDQE
jgi:hypothetical protein